MLANMCAQQLHGAFEKAGDLNEADPHPFNAAVDEFCSMRNTRYNIISVKEVLTNDDDTEATVEFGDKSLIHFDWNGKIMVYDDSDRMTKMFTTKNGKQTSFHQMMEQINEQTDIRINPTQFSDITHQYGIFLPLEEQYESRDMAYYLDILDAWAKRYGFGTIGDHSSSNQIRYIHQEFIPNSGVMLVINASEAIKEDKPALVESAHTDVIDRFWTVGKRTHIQIHFGPDKPAIEILAGSPNNPVAYIPAEYPRARSLVAAAPSLLRAARLALEGGHIKDQKMRDTFEYVINRASGKRN